MSPAALSFIDKGRKTLLVSMGIVSLVLCAPGIFRNACAQEVPASADVGRVQSDRERNLPQIPPHGESMIPSASAFAAIPEGADSVHLILRNIIIDGSTSFAPTQLASIYTPYLNKDITLDMVYVIVARVTELYRNEGYFLSLAYVPEQKINNGIVHIRVIEGYISETDIDPKVFSHSVIRAYTERLMSTKPLKSDDMESFLLRMSDLSGYDFRAILSPLPDQPQGSIKLTLVSEKEKGKGMVTFDNFSSRFLGPNEVSASYETSLIPLQQTSISVLAAVPTDKLKYLTLGHAMMIAPDLELYISGNITRSSPGYTLAPLEIESSSNFLSAGIEWQYIRQRNENLSFSATLDRRDTNIDFLDTPFTRDKVRALRMQASYDGKDSWGGYNWANVIITKGLSILGPSEKGNDNLSREEAKPDFTKAEMILTHWNELPQNLSLIVSAAGQLSSGPMYSSEEFGYGGQSFGRAYDSSEITGDHGVSASAELQYQGLDLGEDISLSPYMFYDIGIVWNEDDGQPKRESGASAGIGARFETSVGLSFNGGLAFPLTRSIEAPVTGSDENGPRIFLQLTQRF